VTGIIYTNTNTHTHTQYIIATEMLVVCDFHSNDHILWDATL